MPRHTPYDGSTKPFTIALKTLDPNEWIELGADLETCLAEKDRLYAAVPDKVFVEEAGTRAAQQEVLDMLVPYLAGRFPGTYRRSDTGIEILGTGRHVATDSTELPPLRTASLLVPEDLILMRGSKDGWRLVAGSLCFPSSWSLGEKFGHTLQDIHEPVPAFGPGTRTAGMIQRIFDNLLVDQPVQRFNWSLQAGNVLFLPFSQQQRIDRATNRPSKFSDDELAAQAFIRVERQTLRRLPNSRDILFTIRIYLDPLAVLSRHPDRASIAASFASQLAALDLAQLDYKGLTADRDRLVAVLGKMATTT
ncbi:uncharacterized protein DUF3445 [Pseudaminobacter salicylatoxidans]|uniref:Uncharacterized protein DUF3445 n=1 Tax=Pseudaminobacter salicylatoxidans TaxID=93369 RepID=A0A316C2I2_PSESE|nr:DUF3445 domain-containing protein [Pseudaminobacter salicylatoxidans]PWJ83818.1 uncharacterized protein DUF3445 [Pseudaminobacter salicylatoxidans]